MKHRHRRYNPDMIRLRARQRYSDQVYADQSDMCLVCFGPMVRSDRADHRPRGYRFPETMATLQHVIPLSEGGGTGRDNLVGVCSRCHKLSDGLVKSFYNGGWWSSVGALEGAPAA